MFEMNALIELYLLESPSASETRSSSDTRAKTLGGRSPAPPEGILIVPDGNEDQTAI